MSSTVQSREEAKGRVLAKDLAPVREFSLNDWAALVYLVGLNLVLLGAEPGPARTLNQWRFGALLLACTAAITWARSGSSVALLRVFVHRTAHFGALLGSYLLFRDFLPVANPNSLDLELYQLDLDWFGIEPALYWDSRLSPVTTEWFAFFYYSYFILVGLHVFPILYWSRNDTLVAQFTVGMALVALIGHTGYILVPGYGPYKALADSFENPLVGGLFWDLVQETVATGGALKDIFPSLHTAFPSFIALLSFHHRKQFPFRYSWPVVAFVVANIIVATMYLRWHYLIDVVAGFALAFVAYFASVRWPPREAAFRAQRGLTPTWPSWPQLN